MAETIAEGVGSPEPERSRPRSFETGGHVHREQEALWGELLSLADYVEAALKTAIETVCEGRQDLVAAVRADEKEIDRWEVRIEQGCLRVLALYDLVASDLRRIVAVLRINRELEGLADLAENLAKRARKLHRDPLAGTYMPRLRTLAEASIQLVDRGLASLRTMDSRLAREVILSDNDVDRQRVELLDDLKQAIRDNPERVNTWVRLINSSRNLERAGDHATHIAESVVYLKEGVVIRRGKADDGED